MGMLEVEQDRPDNAHPSWSSFRQIIKELTEMREVLDVSVPWTHEKCLNRIRDLVETEVAHEELLEHYHANQSR